MVVQKMSHERVSNINVDATRTRLTQIRKQARCKYLLLDEKRGGDSRCRHSQGKIIRLNQIKHQARCKSENDLSQKKTISESENEQPKGRILRLSQIKRRARSKDNATVTDGTEKRMDQTLPCNNFTDKENVIAFAGQAVKKSICQQDSNPSVQGVPAHNLYRGACQLSDVLWDVENLKELQRTARRLRIFKTKKLRQQLRTECKQNLSNASLHVITAANSEAPKEFIPMKRLRLTELRREARLGNHFPALQGLPRN
ncbi:uncharacterized protein LOC124842847 isoform X1 [Vigna umbellata]|uniref:uncharacterized protein LOC124842847 isoform X1 n=1 Tax=Vigna umbellata TaxID=87088 RepID=UPI001F5F19E2|nr:uncharacterized protein LOC124842847 isoform X1 [Vigna umbellata]XP_047175389.1 uncharacterized protein LOC124842847 isoform X1 [Vigna umbellata]